LLVDWQMPGLDGLSALAALGQAYGRARVPAAVVVSASEATAVRGAPNADLADAVLTKPVGPSALFNAVNAAVARQQGSHERLLRSTRLVPDARWLAGVRVLVVDDSEVNLDVARHLLERQGAEVHTASDGRQALEALRRQPVDAVLMDVQMPVMDGNEATRELRRDPAFATLPVIALTAGALLAERQRSLEAGMSDFLTKPLEPELLVRTLRRHVEAARGQPVPAVALAAAIAAGGPDTAWPAIQGMQTDEARARLAGDRALFLRLLRRLLSEHAHLADEPAGGWAAVEDGQPWAAALHKLRGAAGTVAAVAVHRLAGEAETAARTQQPGPALARLMPALAQALHDLELHARPWLAQAAAAGSGPAGPPPEAAALQALRRLLAQRDLAALASADALDAGLRAWLGPAGHARWRERLEALDFDGAEALLASREAGAA
jgi:CheY-like chemotaxis protein/HPt (histidine-containing phosphotransfer) domain-containing protein